MITTEKSLFAHLFDDIYIGAKRKQQRNGDKNNNLIKNLPH